MAREEPNYQRRSIIFQAQWKMMSQISSQLSKSLCIRVCDLAINFMRINRGEMRVVRALSTIIPLLRSLPIKLTHKHLQFKSRSKRPMQWINKRLILLRSKAQLKNKLFTQTKTQVQLMSKWWVTHPPTTTFSMVDSTVNQLASRVFSSMLVWKVQMAKQKTSMMHWWRLSGVHGLTRKKKRSRIRKRLNNPANKATLKAFLAPMNKKNVGLCLIYDLGKSMELVLTKEKTVMGDGAISHNLLGRGIVFKLSVKSLAKMRSLVVKVESWRKSHQGQRSDNY